MSCAAHQREIDKDDPRHRLHAIALRLKACQCPFCGKQEIYVHTPSAGRGWWIVGCESRRCDSIWRIAPDTGEKALEMLEHSQPSKNAKANTSE